MRYAVFSDIHANLQAWHAVLRDIRLLEADVLVCLGDVIGYGPMPEQVLNAIRAETQNFVIGNHDAAAVGVYINSDLFNPLAKEAIEWTREQLSEESKRFLAETPLTLETEELLFVHAEISEPSRFEYITDRQSASENLDSNDHFLTFVGHTHHPVIFDRGPDGNTRTMVDDDCRLEEGHRYIVNVGSVGEPRNPDDVRARYVIYDSDTRELYFRRINFDHGAYRKDLAASGLGVVPFFLRVLDHSALVHQEALRAVEQEMQTPAVWDPKTRSTASEARHMLHTGGEHETHAVKPKPKPLPSQAKSPVSRTAALIVLLLLLAIGGVTGILQNNRRAKDLDKQAHSPPVAPAETSVDPFSPPEPSVESKDEPASYPVETVKAASNDKPPTPPPAPVKQERKPSPPVPAKTAAPTTPEKPAAAEIPVLAYWSMNSDSEGASLIDGLGNYPLRAATPGRTIDKLAPDPVPLTGLPNGSALTLGIWTEESPSGAFDLSNGSSFTFEGWIMVGGDTSPIRIASAQNWQLDIKSGENEKSPGSMRFRLGAEPNPIDVLAREIGLHSSDPHHFAVVWNHKGTDPGSGTLKLFFDAREVASQTIPYSKIPAPSPAPFQIGDASNTKRVALDEVRFSKDVLNAWNFLTGPIGPVILFKARFEKQEPTATQSGKTVGDMTLFGNTGMTLEGLQGWQRLISNEHWRRADIFTTLPIDMAGITRKSYRVTWVLGATGSGDAPTTNKPTRGHHLTLRDGKGLVAQLGDGTPRTYIDYKGVSLQFINNNFQLVADTGNADKASIILTGGTFSTAGKSFHSGFTATLGIDGNGWTLKIDGIAFNEGKKPKWEGLWKDKGISPANLFTADMHLGVGCTSDKSRAKISLQGLSAELVPIK